MIAIRKAIGTNERSSPGCRGQRAPVHYVYRGVSKATFEILNAIVKVHVKIALTAGGSFGLMFQHFGSPLNLGRLPLQFVHLDGQFNETAARDDPFECDQAPLDFREFDQYGIFLRWCYRAGGRH